MKYAAEYRIEVPKGATAGDIRQLIEQKAGLTGVQGLSSNSGTSVCDVEYDLLQIGAGLSGLARSQHIGDVEARGPMAITESDFVFSMKAQPNDKERKRITEGYESETESMGYEERLKYRDGIKYSTFVVKVSEQGAISVTPGVIEEVKAELSGK